MICSLSRDPLDYVLLTINIMLDYGISARGEIGTLCPEHQSAVLVDGESMTLIVDKLFKPVRLRFDKDCLSNLG